jgi:hypothetical protein
MSYTNWNDFITDWHRLPPSAHGGSAAPALIRGWNNPNLIPIYNSGAGDYSIKYIPEPWWGNNGQERLQSIVLNYNPGQAGPAQGYANAHLLLAGGSYSDFVASEVRNYVAGSATMLPPTNNWHFVKRAIPIYRALVDTATITAYSSERDYYAHHLSVELAPWHTKGVTGSLLAYINANLRALFDDALFFAAEQSLRINNKKLNKKVIIRASGSRIDHLLKSLRFQGISNYTLHPFGTAALLHRGNGRCMRFMLSEINKRLGEQVVFLCIWGTTSRNDFPSRLDLKDIFSAV